MRDTPLTKPTNKEIVFSGLFIALLIWVNARISDSDIEQLCNPGAAFGIMLPSLLFALLWISVMAVVVWTLLQSRRDEIYKRYGLFLILIGGTANIADRFLHGCVIDYIRLVPWNSFNIADTCIFIGALGVLYSVYQKKEG